MKILAIHAVGSEHLKAETPIDIWRIWRPMEELKKHVDWQIDYQATPVKDIEKYADEDAFMKRGLEKSVAALGEHDIVFCSYYTERTFTGLMHLAHKHHGTKFILDQDDDLFNVDPENPFWLAVNNIETHALQQTARITKYISTTTPMLAKRLKSESTVDAKIFTIPNYIADSYKPGSLDNGERIVIGFFGGASHYHDLHETGLLPALERIMHKYKSVHFKCVGQPIDHYLPTARVEYVDVAKGRKWVDELFPTLNFDISVAPLRQTLFNLSKSNIKWQESTRMGAAFVGSKIGPYASLKDGTASLVDNTEESWYEALEQMVTDTAYRKKTLQTARRELKNWRLEDHWPEYQKMFEEVYEDTDDRHV